MKKGAKQQFGEHVWIRNRASVGGQKAGDLPLGVQADRERVHTRQLDGGPAQADEEHQVRMRVAARGAMQTEIAPVTTFSRNLCRTRAFLPL